MSRLVTVQFTDGQTRRFPVKDGQSVLAGAKAEGHALVSQCQVGTCSTCVANLVSGEVVMPDDRPVVLSQDEINQGHRLLCQARALSDATLQVEYPSTLLSANPPQQFRGQVAAITWLASDVVELVFKLPKRLRFGFTAGQYCRINIPGTYEWRSYSMASGEHEKGKLVFLVRILPDGVMSNYLRDRAKVGDVLDLDGPQGGFVLSPDPRPTILMAGGTGLAPMMAMLSRLRYVKPAPPPILLLFGCPTGEQLFHLDELEARTSFMPMLTVRTVIDDNTGAPHIEQGNPVSALLAEDVGPDTVAYLCGPPGMLRAAEHKLDDLGVAQEDIRMEQFLDSSN